MKLLSPQQLLLGLILGLVLALLLPALGGRQRPPGFAEVRVSTVDPYESEVLEPYGRFRDAVAAGDTATLAELASGRDFLAYRAALTLARDPALAPAARLGHYQRMLVLRLDDPLARSERRSLHLEMARVAEAAGDAAVAVASYREALPEDEAVEALKRLQTNPYRLANSFLQDRLNRLALEALGGLTVHWASTGRPSTPTSAGCRSNPATSTRASARPGRPITWAISTPPTACSPPCPAATPSTAEPSSPTARATSIGR